MPYSSPQCKCPCQKHPPSALQAAAPPHPALQSTLAIQPLQVVVLVCVKHENDVVTGHVPLQYTAHPKALLSRADLQHAMYSRTGGSDIHYSTLSACKSALSMAF